MTTVNFRELREQLDREYNEKINALNTVQEQWKHLHPVHRVTSPSEKPNKFSFKVRKAIDGLKATTFTANDVTSQLLRDHLIAHKKLKRMMLINTLNRLATRGELSVVAKGRGRGFPASYQKTAGQ